MKQPPPGWGLDSLTASIDAGRSNQYGSFHQHAVAPDVINLDGLLWKVLEGHIDPKPFFPMQFFLRSHSCFRAAAGCALAGQVYESTVLQRAALEAAGYALYIGSDQEKALLWLRRGDSKKLRAQVRDEFGFGNLRRYFEQLFPALAAPFKELYETLLDFGAHPNEPGFSMNTSVRSEVGKKLIETV